METTWNGFVADVPKTHSVLVPLLYSHSPAFVVRPSPPLATDKGCEIWFLSESIAISVIKAHCGGLRRLDMSKTFKEAILDLAPKRDGVLVIYGPGESDFIRFRRQHTHATD